jgi:glutamine cyclotransferase
MIITPLKLAAKLTVSAITRWGVPRVKPEIVRTMPHDHQAFTQGLAYIDGQLYESFRQKPNSRLRRLDLRDGRTVSEVLIPNDFAEGIAVLDGLIYQLTWKSEKARVFRLPDLTLVRELRYQGEGWGLCAGPDSLLIKSDGTGTLQFVDRQMQVVRKLRVTVNRFPTRRLNDLECVNGTIFANVLFSTDILEISVEKGCVTRIIDCSALATAAAPDDTEHVLNGIAYNPDQGTFFATGKCWPLLFELRIPNPPAPSTPPPVPQ